MTQPATQPATVTQIGNPLIPADIVISTDDRVRLVGEYRVVGVRHDVDDKTGEVIRIQILKPISIQLCPWDPSDPTDDGIVRARPRKP
jgi:hypothetical protein